MAGFDKPNLLFEGPGASGWRKVESGGLRVERKNPLLFCALFALFCG
jgi:hypothetical protein